MFRLLVRDAGGDNEQPLLRENMPTWVHEAALEVGLVALRIHEIMMSFENRLLC